MTIPTSSTATATATATPPLGDESEPAPAVAPLLQEESTYERVTSLLMAVIIGTAIVVIWLALIYMTNQSYGEEASAPISIIEVQGGAGGRPEGEEDSTERIDIPEAAAAAFASNNELQPSDFEEPALQEQPSAMLKALTQQDFADLAQEMDRGGPVASGVRASKLGTGAAPYGFGQGDGGVPRPERWSILYNPGQTLEEYARQLDYFGVEMATVKDGQMHYARNFSQAQPDVRVASRGNDDRLYFLWQGGGRRESDIQLLQKAGIEVGPRDPIFQFYPEQVEQLLARLETQHAGLQPQEIRTTRFQVMPSGSRYIFKVMEQQPLNP